MQRAEAEAAVTFSTRFRKSRRNIMDSTTLLSLPQRREAEAGEAEAEAEEKTEV